MYKLGYGIDILNKSKKMNYVEWVCMFALSLTTCIAMKFILSNNLNIEHGFLEYCMVVKWFVVAASHFAVDWFNFCIIQKI